MASATKIGRVIFYHCYNRQGQGKLSKVAPGNLLPNTCTYFQLMSWSKFGKHWISMWISIDEGHEGGFMRFVAPYSLFVVLLASVFSPTTSILYSCLVGSNLVFAALRSPLSSCCCCCCWLITRRINNKQTLSKMASIYDESRPSKGINNSSRKKVK